MRPRGDSLAKGANGNTQIERLRHLDERKKVLRKDVSQDMEVCDLLDMRNP
jgi:hypothetical protein